VTPDSWRSTTRRIRVRPGSDRLEYEAKSAVEPRLWFSDPLYEVGVLAMEPPKSDERTHDLDVDCHGP
jgi:hypothetical protein